MADSDHEYGGSDDDIPATGAGPSNGRSVASRPKERAQARWEAGATRNWQLQEAADGSIEGVLGGIEEAAKRKRSAAIALTPQSGANFNQTRERYNTPSAGYHQTHDLID